MQHIICHNQNNLPIGYYLEPNGGFADTSSPIPAIRFRYFQHDNFKKIVKENKAAVEEAVDYPGGVVAYYVFSRMYVNVFVHSPCKCVSHFILYRKLIGEVLGS